MTEPEKNIKPYSVTDIQKYLTGTLSATEMHDFEKAALEDPLLADAVEGVQHLENAGGFFDKGMEDLAGRLQMRVAEENKKRVIPVSANRLWWRAAAALIILLAVSALTFTYLVNKKSLPGNIAILKQPAVPGSHANVPPSKADSTRNTAIAPASHTADSGQASASRSLKLNKPTPSKNILKKNEGPVDKLVHNESANTPAVDLKSDTIPFATAPVPAKTMLQPEQVPEGKVAGAPSRLRRSSAGYIQGRVIDANLQPVAGATISLKGLNKNVSTDKNGDFKLETGPADSAKVVVNSVGYQPVSVILRNSDANLIQLQPSTSALNEVVISGYGHVRKQEIADEDSTEDDWKDDHHKEKVSVLKAMPANGWKEFGNYITRNKKIFTADSTTRGTETISFTVDKRGRRSSFQIDKSLSPAHDAEAIRLIKEGPSWRLLKGKTARVTVNIAF